MSITPRSRAAFLRLAAVAVGLMAVPALAASRGAPESSQVTANLAVLQAPPPVIFVAIGVAMVLTVVGRRARRGFGNAR